MNAYLGNYTFYTIFDATPPLDVYPPLSFVDDFEFFFREKNNSPKRHT